MLHLYTPLVSCSFHGQVLVRVKIGFDVDLGNFSAVTGILSIQKRAEIVIGSS